ncbi:MAG: NAD(P)/FAD-dependent oxidoreductase [Ornithinimicrobium sp.]
MFEQTTADVSVLVVGGGPAGVSAALQARQLGATVRLLESRDIGSSTLNRGPAPLRTLARAARLARDWRSWSQFGLTGPAPVPDLAAMLANSERVAHYASDRRDVAGDLHDRGIDVVDHAGAVHFIDPHTIVTERGQTFSADRIILAVGGHAGRLSMPGADLAWTYEDLRQLRVLPDRIAMIGGADTGCQLASIFADFGSDVTVLEAGPVLIPAADPSVSTEFGRALTNRGIRVRTQALVSSLSREGQGLRVDFSSGGEQDCVHVDAAFFAVGWPANIGQLHLDAADVQATAGAIPVDQFLRSNVEHIFAVGDVNGRSMLVQTARIEGRIAARNAVLGPARQASYDVIPSGSFTDPEYGRVGMTEPEARQEHDVVVGIAHYRDLLRPIADGRPNGFCKIIAERSTGVILGAHVVGEYSAETVQTVASCMAGGLGVEHVADLQFAFPTFTEAVSMAAQKICREIGLGDFPYVWSYLGSQE